MALLPVVEGGVDEDEEHAEDEGEVEVAAEHALGEGGADVGGVHFEERDRELLLLEFLVFGLSGAIVVHDIMYGMGIL